MRLEEFTAVRIATVTHDVVCGDVPEGNRYGSGQLADARRRIRHFHHRIGRCVDFKNGPD